MPDHSLQTNEIIRPFVIMQPQYKICSNKDSLVYKKATAQKGTDAPNSNPFFKEVNLDCLEKYKGKLPQSRALLSEMQNRTNTYLSLNDELEYKTLYGEKNPA